MFAVSATIRYLDGTLAGLTIPAGFRITTPDHASALRTFAWLGRVRRARDFVRATGTGSRYEIVGDVCLERLA
jgi:hypothetical protein